MESSGWRDTFHLPRGSEHAFKNRQLDPLKLSLEGLRAVSTQGGRVQSRLRERNLYKHVARVTDGYGRNVVSLDLMALVISGLSCYH